MFDIGQRVRVVEKCDPESEQYFVLLDGDTCQLWFQEDELTLEEN